MIEIKNLSKHYNDKTIFKALDNISFNIDDNDSLGIVGYSGAGKSTLVRLINGLIKPTSGDIIIDGKSILDLSNKDLNLLRQNIGMVFQHFNLLTTLTVYQNIELALKISKYSKEEREDRIYEVLKLVNLLDEKDLYPKSLSGGEKQRVGISRAISTNPKYLLCDEITSALDNKTTDEIINVLNDIKKKREITIIFISHDLDVVRRFCNRVVVMEAGKVVEYNDTKLIFTNPEADATKKLIKSIINFDSYYGEDVYKLTYKGSAGDKTLISDIIKNYNIKLSIQAGLTLDILDESIGYLVVKFTGENLPKAFIFLEDNGVKIEKLERRN